MESCLNANSLQQHIFLGHGRFDSLEVKCNKCRGVKLVQRSFEKKLQLYSINQNWVNDEGEEWKLVELNHDVNIISRVRIFCAAKIVF